ncbi:MAG: hypothetical protein OXN94_14225 [Chloroflexota bacterium]|nr:hypothetical protein [Chloroflexota bacterium]
MRYLHPVQAHESFVASGDYSFAKDGRRLSKTESWTIHELGDGSKFLRVDSDAREEEGKSLLAELLIGRDDEIIRFDLRYDNDQFEGGIRTLSATYSLVDRVMRVGYRMNGAARSYLEREIAPEVWLDIPLLIMRGRTLFTLSECRGKAVSVFVPMFEHAQLFPGVTRVVESPVELLGCERLVLGKREIATQRFRYVDKAASYWVDEQGIVIKRINAFKQHEFTVTVSNYAHRPA